MNQIPENYTDFLYWVKKTTESFWAKEPEEDEDDEHSTKWLDVLGVNGVVFERIE